MKPVAPVIIYYGTKDTAVPIIMGKLYQEQMCALGAQIERVQLPASHFDPWTEPCDRFWRSRSAIIITVCSS